MKHQNDEVENYDLTENDDQLISNTEIAEREFYYLSTLKSYLENQLEQVNLSLEKHATKLR